ncbi:MAG: type II toxin-antitoxin system prevent-host-death family antitoxin [Candidatus Binatia bacterium]
MQTQSPPTQTMKISEVKSRLNSLVNDVYRQETRIVVEKSGIPVAAIIPIADLRRLIRLDEQDREAREIVEAMRVPFDDVPDEEIERQTERIMHEIREENRAARQRVAQTV